MEETYRQVRAKAVQSVQESQIENWCIEVYKGMCVTSNVTYFVKLQGYANTRPDFSKTLALYKSGTYVTY